MPESVLIRTQYNLSSLAVVVVAAGSPSATSRRTFSIRVKGNQEDHLLAL
jgi:hypothetical protein